MDRMNTPAAEVNSTPEDRDFDAFTAQVQSRFRGAVTAGSRLFLTDAIDLFDTYLAAMPAHGQAHNCDACRRFLARYGGLVTIDASGQTCSALWSGDGLPEFYRPVGTALRRVVDCAAVVGVYLDSSPVWGRPTTGPWTHLAVTPPTDAIFHSALQTAGQAMAEKREDYATVQRALAEFTLGMLTEACRVLDSEALYRSEKVAGPARWLLDLQKACLGARAALRTNLVWRAVATAPPGFCHPRSTMVGTLLDDIVAGLSFADVARRFAAKMHPLQYQRPQAAPSAGNIARAEKLVEQLGIARSLERRFATVDEVEALWRPDLAPSESAATGGVFGHLKPKKQPSSPALDLPPTTMTWTKFAKTVLPTAKKIEVYVGPGPQNFTALLTATHADAPPILQWDAIERRNPVSFYVYSEGSPPKQWSLAGGRYHQATAIVGHPARWGQPEGAMSHQGNILVFVLDGARETRSDQGNAIFPETLKSELREVRATIESYARSAVIGPPPEGAGWACGLLLAAGQGHWDARVRVRTDGEWQTYRLDRWD